ncbi:hypothetical protein [Mucilaginibacter lappiensis]|uniref:Uncharacterized protein n=1 Tax=Mucilaginibacter lappiensis TaxID=354630 RepID=A0A1N7B1W9_9SPHI|nr:hypothetical protein [Mucilaginibacter lappiensis]MBB6110678.1 hypothetical protein [Mucilaginibacter lappiensis]MBB6128274.1 hypothetical protein [Mucilaginibacter lappiensis]SIR45282.1 hypothetical protein SAMN05421821_107201 [Mucilaginibacter lappiensis]
MKGLMIIFFLLTCTSAFAQKRDTFFYVDGPKKKMIMCSSVIDSNRSYVTVNGRAYTGLLDSLNTDNIIQFKVLKATEAVAILGKKGKNGAIQITMKVSHITGKSVAGASPGENDITDYILDGRRSNKMEISHLGHRILSSKSEKKSAADPSKNKVILIAVTRNYAIKQYQTKLSRLSTGYKTYLNKHHHDDKGLTFIINGEKYAVSTDDRIKKIYELISDDKIQDLNLKYVMGFGRTPSFVKIDTK